MGSVLKSVDIDNVRWPKLSSYGERKKVVVPNATPVYKKMCACNVMAWWDRSVANTV